MEQASTVPAQRVSTLMLRALVEVVKQRGVAPEALLGQSLDALYVEPAEQTLTRAELEVLLARAAELTHEPAIGLACGLHASEASFGLMSPLVAHAPSLRRALELVVQFQPLLIDGLCVRLSERTGVAQLRCELQGAQRGLIEIIMAGLMRTLRSFGCARDELRAVSFEHARPAYYPAYTAAFHGTERFARAFTGIEFCALALDRPHLHRHAELHTLVLAQAEHKLQRLCTPLSYTERVRALMHNRAVSELPDMVDAARSLGVSVRSLRRHLEEEGSSFRALTQSALHDCACSMLRNPAFTLHAIAHALGFANASAFHRAFRRWSKRTPAEYRSAFLAGAHSAPLTANAAAARAPAWRPASRDEGSRTRLPPAALGG